MDREELRRWGYHWVDWVANYWENLEDRPVLPQTSPGDLRRALPATLPEEGGGPEVWATLTRELDEQILPRTTHWQHPAFFAYFPANASGASFFGELVSAGLAVQGMLWQTGPAMTELETWLLDAMADLMALPRSFRSDSPHLEGGGGVIQGTASEATLVALIAARDAALRRHPAASLGDLTLYASTEAHSSVIKAARLAGLARDLQDRRQLRLIPVDAEGRMQVQALAEALAADRAAGRIPCFVAATLGTTGTTALDPLPEIGALLAQEAPEVWLHVDAAFYGALALLPEKQPSFAGLEYARSLVINAHKWLLTHFDCSLFWTRDRRALLEALTISPEYLRNAASSSGAVIDYRDWQIPLGRRFRALKLWFVLRRLGAEGLRAHLRRHLDWAAWFAAQVDADPRLARVAPLTCSLVVFRAHGSDERNRAWLAAVQATGEVFLSPTMAPTPSGPRFALRMAIGGALTERRHVELAWRILQETLPPEPEPGAAVP